jgi:hypothetical protein
VHRPEPSCWRWPGCAASPSPLLGLTRPCSELIHEWPADGGHQPVDCPHHAGVLESCLHSRERSHGQSSPLGGDRVGHTRDPPPLAAPRVQAIAALCGPAPPRQRARGERASGGWRRASLGRPLLGMDRGGERLRQNGLGLRATPFLSYHFR